MDRAMNALLWLFGPTRSGESATLVSAQMQVMTFVRGQRRNLDSWDGATAGEGDSN